MVNVLFTSAGRRVELVRAFRRAEQELGLQGNIVAVDANPLAPVLQEADRRYVVPRVTDPAYLPALAEICRKEEVGLVFPTIDPDILVLAAHREEFEATGARVMVVGTEAAETTADKWLTYELFRRLEIPVPDTWLGEEARTADIGLPAFIKPRIGSASQDAFRVRDRRELDFFLDYVPSPIVQELLPGPEITNDVICDLSGEVLAVVSRERIEVRSGEVQKGKTIHSPALSRHCEAIAQALGAVGPITVQCMMKNGTPYFTEVNCRYGGGAPLGFAAGADSPRWYLSLAAGKTPEVPSPSYAEGVYMTRYDDGLYLTEEQLAETSRNHLRPG